VSEWLRFLLVSWRAGREEGFLLEDHRELMSKCSMARCCIVRPIG